MVLATTKSSIIQRNLWILFFNFVNFNAYAFMTIVGVLLFDRIDNFKTLKILIQCNILFYKQFLCANFKKKITFCKNLFILFHCWNWFDLVLVFSHICLCGWDFLKIYPSQVHSSKTIRTSRVFNSVCLQCRNRIQRQNEITFPVFNRSVSIYEIIFSSELISNME